MKHLGLILLGICLIVGACSDTKKVAPKEGRLAIIDTVDIPKSSEKIRLDKGSNLAQWSSVEFNELNKIPAVSLRKATSAWQQGGMKGKKKLSMVSPIIVKNVVYTLDSESEIIAHDIKTGSELWKNNLKPKKQGIGLAADKDFIVAVDENGYVALFNHQGKQLWEKEFKTTFRGSPLISKNMLYLLSSGNDLWALETKTGKEKWHYKTMESLTLLQGMGHLALANNILVVPFSTGEVAAFDAVSGNLLWSQDLIGNKVFDAVATLSQITASPVIENGIVYLIGHGGKTMAVNLRTGESLWELSRGGKMTPLINGNAFFFVDNKNNLLAINKKNGKLFWEVALEDTVWKGPYLIDEKLVLFSDEKSVSVIPATGAITYDQKNGIKGSSPAFTDNGIFFLGNNGKLYHWEKI